MEYHIFTSKDYSVLYDNAEKAIEYCRWLIDKCNDGEAIDEFDMDCIIEILKGRE